MTSKCTNVCVSRSAFLPDAPFSLMIEPPGQISSLPLLPSPTMSNVSYARASMRSTNASRLQPQQSLARRWTPVECPTGQQSPCPCKGRRRWIDPGCFHARIRLRQSRKCSAASHSGQRTQCLHNKSRRRHLRPRRSHPCCVIRPRNHKCEGKRDDHGV